MNYDDGGPAFPQQLSDGQRERGGNAEFGNGGMTLRDYFAVHATEDDIAEFMPATVGDAITFEIDHGFRATRQWARYEHADAMIAARKGQQ